MWVLRDSPRSFNRLVGWRFIFLGVPGGVLKYDPESSWRRCSKYSNILVLVVDSSCAACSTMKTPEFRLSSGLSGLSAGPTFCGTSRAISEFGRFAVSMDIHN